MGMTPPLRLPEARRRPGLGAALPLTGGFLALLLGSCGLLGPPVSPEGQARCRRELAQLANPLARPLARQRCLASVDARLRQEALERQQRLERALALCRQRAPRLRALAANLQAAATNLRALNAERYVPSPAPQPPDERTESRFRREDQELDQERYNDAYGQWQQEEQQRSWAWEQRQASRRRAARERLDQAARALRALQPNLFRSPRSLELDGALLQRLSQCNTRDLAATPATPGPAPIQP